MPHYGANQMKADPFSQLVNGIGMAQHIGRVLHWNGKAIVPKIKLEKDKDGYPIYY
tara:strand:+ start:8311 stop:8478 length:168 start_codon:yes stop_codon:yes gene_type:complete